MQRFKQVEFNAGGVYRKPGKRLGTADALRRGIHAGDDQQAMVGINAHDAEGSGKKESTALSQEIPDLQRNAEMVIEDATQCLMVIQLPFTVGSKQVFGAKTHQRLVLPRLADELRGFLGRDAAARECSFRKIVEVNVPERKQKRPRFGRRGLFGAHLSAGR